MITESITASTTIGAKFNGNLHSFTYSETRSVPDDYEVTQEDIDNLWNDCLAEVENQIERVKEAYNG